MKFKDHDLLELRKSKYDDGHIAIAAVYDSDKSGFEILTVEAPDFNFPFDEVAIKTWGRAKEMLETLFDTGLFEDTGKRARSSEKGVVTELWSITKRNLAKLPDIPNK